MRSVLAAGACVLALASLRARRAGAQEEDPEALFEQARVLMEAGQYANACPKLAESQRRAPLLPKLAFLAVCHEREGKTATAWREYNEVAEAARQAGLADREAKARALAAALEPKLLKIRFELAEHGPNTAVVVDGVPLPEAALEGATPIDPGEHRVDVSAPGKRSWSTVITVAAGGTGTPIAVPPLQDEVTAKVTPLGGTKEDNGGPAPRARGAADPPVRAVDGADPGLPLYVAGGVSAGLGTAWLVAGTYLGLQAFSFKADSDASCIGGCTQAGVTAMNDARTASQVSTAAFVIGAASVATGAFLLGWGATRTPHVRLGVAPAGASLYAAW